MWRLQHGLDDDLDANLWLVAALAERGAELEQLDECCDLVFAQWPPKCPLAEALDERLPLRIPGLLDDLRVHDIGALWRTGRYLMGDEPL